ncbi:MAG: hypothetical protein OHK0048_14390 [Rhodoferax sp.]
MNNTFKSMAWGLSASLVAGVAWAKLPPPTDEAKAKAAEAKAKTAWASKVSDYQLCKAQDRVVAHYKKTAPAKGASSCVDPGPFVYTPESAAAPAAPAGAAPVPVAATAAKKP